MLSDPVAPEGSKSPDANYTPATIEITAEHSEDCNGADSGDVQNPKDARLFDKYYFETHVPIAKRILGIRKYEVSQGPIVTPAGASGLHLIATLHFDDLAAIQDAFASAVGRGAAADVQKFATGGVDMFLFDSREI